MEGKEKGSGHGDIDGKVSDKEDVHRHKEIPTQAVNTATSASPGIATAIAGLGDYGSDSD